MPGQHGRNQAGLGRGPNLIPAQRLRLPRPALRPHPPQAVLIDVADHEVDHLCVVVRVLRTPARGAHHRQRFEGFLHARPGIPARHIGRPLVEVCTMKCLVAVFGVRGPSQGVYRQRRPIGKIKRIGNHRLVTLQCHSLGLDSRGCGGADSSGHTQPACAGRGRGCSNPEKCATLHGIPLLFDCGRMRTIRRHWAGRQQVEKRRTCPVGRLPPLPPGTQLWGAELCTKVRPVHSAALKRRVSRRRFNLSRLWATYLRFRQA